jgi:hypothetical protein
MPGELPHRPPANPSVLALLTADGLHRDSQGKSYILGVFNRINALHFPARHPPVSVYVALTDGYGSVELELCLVRIADENRPLFSSEFQVEFDNPLDVIETNHVVPAVRFPAPGDYRWQVGCQGEILCERRLIVSQQWKSDL